MAVTLNRVARGVYLDSVALMRISRRISAASGVEDAALMMGTPANKLLLRDAGLLAAEGEQASTNDLVLAARADRESTALAALEAAEKSISSPGPTAQDGTELRRSRSFGGALEHLPGANLALISVPGDYAAREARRALEAGLNVMIFSDNVPIEDEAELKQLAGARGLLLMGPDCGTALIAGTPIAFANAVPRGDIGVVSASGTGLQEFACLVARGGRGLSHGIGVGGRDLDERVGALGTLAAIEALDRDASTRTVVLLSKPPPAGVARRVLERVGQSAKPFVVCFLGLPELALPKNAKLARTLREAAELALGEPIVSAREVPAIAARPRGRWVKGFFCGGTLCAESQLVFLQRGLAVHSNAPVPGASARGSDGAHLFLDLGADEYTRGRPHPMIEPELRNDHVRTALAANSVAAVLVDLVLGFGAHENPAGVLADALRAAGAGRAPVIASVTGTERDPQGYSRQVEILRSAGVIVAPSNAHAAELAASLAR
ncbi:MAG: acyl-CoA synthetase FdrA [Betaproteobacteria bacterium]|nr:acyl-CoA synthetase FdrA [Betaproteobacteria bacterium]